ncbi:MAG: hypothetical protein MUC85_08730 [Anaerolineales bacterium]|jgi:hypothetical protein|nr:hypothetical protein [Anaerolineales bacterium]
MIHKFQSKILRKLIWYAHWRCAEPVVIFESDDWGQQNHPNLDLLKRYGEPQVWAQDCLETPENLENLFRVLEHQQDRYARPACLTANFITANPDFDRIEQSKFESYYEVPFYTNPDLASKWQEGLARQLFFPQYHGRAHMWPKAWLEDLRAGDEMDLELFRARSTGGRTQLKEHSWRYHSEYLNWNSGEKLTGDDLESWLQGGIAHFFHLFGFLPTSTIAPHYIITPEAEFAFCKQGIHSIQGGNYHIIRAEDGSVRTCNHVLGERTSNGLVYLFRMVKFEVRPNRPGWRARQILPALTYALRCRVPLIIDTHRFNYAGPWRSEALEDLSFLLENLMLYQPIFLTSSELGQAILSGGIFVDAFTGKPRRLTPIDSPPRRLLRQALKRLCRI